MRVRLYCYGVICLVMSGMASPALSAPSKTTEEFSFLGFSRNERVAAWQVEVKTRHTRTGAVDRYSLVRIVDTETDEVVATFRNSAIRRRGGPWVGAAALRRDNPPYAEAQPLAAWVRFKSKAHFRCKPLRMDDSTLRLSPDPDTRVSMTAHKYHIDVRAEPGSPIGYQVVARLFDGRLAPLGHFRVGVKRRERLTARVWVYFSPSAVRVAVLNRFSGTLRGKGAAIDIPAIVTLPGEGVATTDVGVFRLVEAELRTAKNLFIEAHPESEELYDQYIGAEW